MKNRLTRWLSTISTTLFAGMTFTGMAFTGMVMAQELGPEARPIGADWSRSPVMSVNGMADTAQPLASNIAIDVLQAGGSAVDAAVAANTARFLHDGGSSTDEGVAADYGILFVEPGVPAKTVGPFRVRGHKVKFDDTAGKFGGYQAISRDPKMGVLTGATEMRKDGTVVGY